MSLASDVSRLDTKSVALELRTAFRVDLVTLQQQQQTALVSKSVAVKAPAARNVYDALAPVVRRYGFKMYECVVLDVRTIRLCHIKTSTIFNNLSYYFKLV